MYQLSQLMKESQLTPNQLYLLWCLFTKDHRPFTINVHTEMRALKNANYVSDDGVITPLGIDLASRIPSKKTILKSNVLVTDDYVDKYLSLFPKGKLPSGKQARADKRNLKSNFEWFFKTYDYDWDTVLKATALYVDEYERKNYLYMKTSQYFISKMNPDRSRDSELANYCYSVVNDDFNVSENHFSEKVV